MLLGVHALLVKIDHIFLVLAGQVIVVFAFHDNNIKKWPYFHPIQYENLAVQKGKVESLRQHIQ